ncbi:MULTISPECIES: hypothetical protein [unclassified Nocardiopsis]|uniref:hypothetical protein n=1 Tax=unclassified Nocardiopsis TaxID=2649073 RepID=UPI0033C50053
MARISRDNFHGGYRVTGLEDDIARARANAQFEQDMSRIAGRVVDAPADAFVGAVRTTGGIAAGGVGVGVRMVRDRRFRYITQAVLHFPMAFFVAFCFVMAYGGEQASILQEFGRGVLIGLIVAVVWTAVYVVLRTRPKLRRLHQY